MTYQNLWDTQEKFIVLSTGISREERLKKISDLKHLSQKVKKKIIRKRIANLPQRKQKKGSKDKSKINKIGKTIQSRESQQS